MRVTFKSDCEISSASEVGYHLRSLPDDRYIDSLSNLRVELEQRSHTYRVSCHPTGGAMGIEVRSEPPKPLYLALPIEDDLKNLPKFLGFYLPGLEKGYQSSKMKLFCDRFIAHCHASLHQEIPFSFETEFRFPWSDKPKTRFTWIPRYGEVGRHVLVREVDFYSVPAHLKGFIELLVSLERVRKNEPKEVYFQFFVPSHSKFDLKAIEPYFYERTFIFDALHLSEADQIVSKLGAQDVVVDTYTVLEQPKAQIGQNCAATYILRKTPTRGFEIRISAAWDKEVNSDQVMVPFEEKTGLAFVKLA